jgi:NAD-dependent DNA ligase
MRKKQKTPKPTELSSKIRGKTFVLVCSDSSTRDEKARLLAELGGVVVREISPRLHYLVVLDDRTDQPTSEEQQADAVNEGDGAVQTLDPAGFRELLSPTRVEALALLQSGDAGLNLGEPLASLVRGLIHFFKASSRS